MFGDTNEKKPLFGSEDNIQYSLGPAAEGSVNGTVEEEESAYMQAKSGVYRTMFNIFCTVVGAGILQLPSALEQSGWIGVGPLATLGLVAAYTAIILTQCFNPPGRPRLHTYAEVGHLAFGLPGKLFAQIVQYAALLGTGTSYLILTGGNMAYLLSSIPEPGTGNYYSLLPLCTNDQAGRYGILIMACFLYFHVFVKTMHEAGILSFFNAFVAVLLAVTIVAEIFGDPVGRHQVYDVVNPKFVQLGGAFSSIIFAYGMHAVPHIYVSMKDKSKFNLVLCIAMAAITCFYVPIAIIGYWAFGTDTTSPIYNNLCNSGDSSNICDIGCSYGAAIGKYIAVFAVTVHLVFSYVLNMNPVEREVEEMLKLETRWGTDPVKVGKVNIDPSWIAFCCRIINRSVIFVIFLIVALIVPDFQDFLNLVSATTSTCCMFILPCSCHMKIFWNSHYAGQGWKGYTLIALNVAIIIMGMVGFVFGSYDAIVSILCYYNVAWACKQT